MSTISPSMWLAQEQARLRTTSPRVWSWLQLAVRFRVLLLVGAAAVSGGFMQEQSLPIGDTTLFLHASHRLLSSDGLNVFQDPTLQVGPLYLLTLGLIGLVAGALHVSAVFLDGFLQAGSVSWLGIYLVGAFSADGGAQQAARDLGIGISLIFGPLAAVGVAGHFEEPLISMFLLLAGLRASQGRDTSAALFVVAASGFRLWGCSACPSC